MKYFEFGKDQKELMVILHGGGTSYRGAEPAARLLGQKYHVVLVAYDGFNPSEPDTEFKSPMDEARRLSDYVVERYGGKIDILYGISYGCRILMEVLGDDRLTITTTIADGMSLRDYPDIKSKWGKDLYCFFFTGLFMPSWGIRDRAERSFSPRFLEESSRKPNASSTAKQPGRAGRIKTMTSSAKRPITACLCARICFCGMASKAPSIKSSPRIWACSKKRAIPLRKRYLPIAGMAGSRASSPSDLWRKSQKRIRKRSFKRKKPLPFGRGS